MHREDNSKYLLYIEPKASEKLKEPIDDELVHVMEIAMSKSIKGSSRYDVRNDMGDGYNHGIKVDGSIRRLPSFAKRGAFMGWHTTDCGEKSDNHDYLLENGMITNSLAPFYLRWYRYSIPETEMKKVHELAEFYS